MKIDCINGFFIFTELKVGQISDFMKYSGLDLVKLNGFYTFSDLEEIPGFTIAGTPFLNLVSTKTYQGEPWELFDQNGVVYNFLTGLLVPIVSVTQLIKLSVAGNKFITSGLILPGSLTPEGKRIKSYSGYFSRDTLNFNYSEVDYV